MFNRPKFSVMLVLMMFSITGLASLTHAQSDAPVDSSALTLIWQTAFDKDSVLIEPDYLTVDSEGNSYIGQLSSGVMRKFDADGKFVLAIQADTQDLTGVGVDSQGNILLVCWDKHLIQIFDSNGKFLENFPADSSLLTPAIALDAQDNVYALWHKFDRQGNLLLAWGGEGTGDGEFGDTGAGSALAVDSEGNVYATDPGNNRIQKFDSNGQFLAAFDMPDDGKFIDHKLVIHQEPYGVAVDGQGNIYVSSSHFLRKLDPQGNIIAQWPTTEGDLYRAGRVAVDADGNIYIVAEGDVMGANNKPFKALVVKKFQQG